MKKNRLENRELVKCVTNCCKFLLVTSMYMPHLMPVTIYKQVLLVNYFNCKVRLVTLFSCINYFINLWILLIENTLEIFFMEKKKLIINLRQIILFMIKCLKIMRDCNCIALN